MKKLLALTMAMALLACAFALPGRAAGEALAVAFSTDETSLPLSSAFTVDVSVTPTGAGVSALRLYVLYDNACFEWIPGVTGYDALITGGMYAIEEAAAPANKYPAGMPIAERDKYGVIVFQWCAIPADGDLPAAEAETTLLSLGFEVRAGAPCAQPGGRIFISTDYSLDYTPWFCPADLAIDISAADLTIQPMPPAPVLQLQGDLDIDGGYIYGFPEELPQVGSVTQWSDADLSQYFTATNGGLPQLVRPEDQRLTGTGTTLQLQYSNGIPAHAYTLIVFGDLTGDFVIDFDDWARLKLILDGAAASDPVLFAADVNHDGTVDEDDLTLLFDAARGADTILQTRESI